MKKKLFLLVAAMFILQACSVDVDECISREVNYEEGYKYLSTIDIGDAEMIYSKFTEDEYDYFKLNSTNEESKISIRDSIGKDYGIHLVMVEKLSDEILSIVPNYGEVEELLPKPETCPGIIQEEKNFQYPCFGDVRTGKLYRSTAGIVYEAKNDASGNLYFRTEQSFYKLNVSNFKLKPLLTGEEVNCHHFEITNNGFLVYWMYEGLHRNSCYIKCPSGTVYAVDDMYTFMFKGNLYSVRDHSIILFKPIGEGIIEEQVVCELPDDFMATNYLSFVPNYVRSSMVISGSNDGLYEFTGEKCINLDCNNIESLSSSLYATSQAWYESNGDSFTKIDMKDYQETTIQIPGYRIREVCADPLSENLSFVAERYIDGIYVIATITENNELIIRKVAEKGEKLSNLLILR